MTRAALVAHVLGFNHGELLTMDVAELNEWYGQAVDIYRATRG